MLIKHDIMITIALIAIIIAITNALVASFVQLSFDKCCFDAYK